MAQGIKKGRDDASESVTTALVGSENETIRDDISDASTKSTHVERGIKRIREK